jgi:hypothetical protein
MKIIRLVLSLFVLSLSSVLAAARKQQLNFEDLCFILAHLALCAQ